MKFRRKVSAKVKSTGKMLGTVTGSSLKGFYEGVRDSGMTDEEVEERDLLKAKNKAIIDLERRRKFATHKYAIIVWVSAAVIWFADILMQALSGVGFEGISFQILMVIVPFALILRLLLPYIIPLFIR